MLFKEETSKLYYSISEVSQMFDINASTIRFWEKEFEALKPTKNKKGNRLYTQKEIDYIKQIVELVKQKGFTIQGAKEQLKNKPSKKIGITSNSIDRNSEVIAKLEEIKQKLISLSDTID
jgi:DNA-binding transcriptional MerR regulator